jgi:hypothetical protein
MRTYLLVTFQFSQKTSIYYYRIFWIHNSSATCEKHSYGMSMKLIYFFWIIRPLVADSTDGICVGTDDVRKNGAIVIESDDGDSKSI